MLGWCHASARGIVHGENAESSEEELRFACRRIDRWFPPWRVVVSKVHKVPAVWPGESCVLFPHLLLGSLCLDTRVLIDWARHFQSVQER